MLPSLLAECNRLCDTQQKRLSSRSAPSENIAALLLGRSDGLAQISLFQKKRSNLAYLCTSPKARLLVELLGKSPQTPCPLYILLRCCKFVCMLRPSRTDALAESLQLSSWWVRRCSLPAYLDLSQLDGDVDLSLNCHIDFSGIEGGEHLTSLSLRAANFSALTELSLSGLALDSLGMSAGSLVNLQKLRVSNFSVTHADALRAVPKVVELHVQGTMGRFDAGQLQSAHTLKELYVASRELLVLTGLSRCESLEILSVHSDSLRDTASFAEAPQLKKLVVIGAAVTVPANYEACRHLHSVSLPWCKNMTSLSELATCAALRRLVVTGSGVRDLNGLIRCELLEEVDCSNCEALQDLCALSAAPQLQTVLASGSGVCSVVGLNTCPFLKVLDVSWCYSLEDLSPLAGAPRLHTLKAACSGVHSIVGLNTCKLLEALNFNYCDRLTSLSPLSGAPALRYVSVRGTALESLAGLENCSCLERVDVQRCQQLADIPDRLRLLCGSLRE